MAFRSGYHQLQNANIVTEKKHFPFKQRNQQPCTKRPEKKKKSRATTKQTNIQLGFRKLREDQTRFSLLKLFENIYGYFSFSFYLRCWLLCLDLRRAFQLQVNSQVASEKLAWKSHPQSGGGESTLVHTGFQTPFKPLLWPWVEDISKTGERNSTERGWERFLMVWTFIQGDYLFLWDGTRRREHHFAEPSWSFPLRSLQFSVGP